MDTARITRLLDRYLDEAITPQELAELEQTLLASPAARELFWQHAGFHALLRQIEAESCGPRMVAAVQAAVQAAEEVEEGIIHHDFGRRVVARWAAIAAAFVIGAILAFAWRSGLGGSDVLAPTEHHAAAVAVLSSTLDLQWSDPSDCRGAGANLEPGWLKIKSGWAQVEFINGARVVLKGPAEFKLISPMEAFCRSGTLSADVPLAAQGFKISTPEAHVVDLGTYFGLEVTKGGGSNLHVFKGEVELQQHGAKRRLLEGNALEVDASGVLREFPSNLAGFPSSEDMSAQTTALNQRRRDAWQSAMLELQDSPALLLHYSFNKESSSDRTLVNDAPSGRSGDGSIVGARWGDGRWLGKSGLEFKGLNDRVRIHAAGEFESLTLMAAVRVDGVSNSFNGLMMSDSWMPGGVHWQINRYGSLVLGVRLPGNTPHRDYNSPPIFSQKRLGQWVHLAVVFDRSARMVSHFVDGQMVSAEPIVSEVLLRIGTAELGNWNTGPQDSKRTRGFSGSMDEFALFNRALTPQEIQRFSAL